MQVCKTKQKEALPGETNIGSGAKYPGLYGSLGLKGFYREVAQMSRLPCLGSVLRGKMFPTRKMKPQHAQKGGLGCFKLCPLSDAALSPSRPPHFTFSR